MSVDQVSTAPLPTKEGSQPNRRRSTERHVGSGKWGDIRPNKSPVSYMAFYSVPGLQAGQLRMASVTVSQFWRPQFQGDLVCGPGTFLALSWLPVAAGLHASAALLPSPMSSHYLLSWGCVQGHDLYWIRAPRNNITLM